MDLVAVELQQVLEEVRALMAATAKEGMYVYRWLLLRDALWLHGVVQSEAPLAEGGYYRRANPTTQLVVVNRKKDR